MNNGCFSDGCDIIKQAVGLHQATMVRIGVVSLIPTILQCVWGAFFMSPSTSEDT